jgi:acetyl/propionyl-CoA carboxylase alpha subunit
MFKKILIANRGDKQCEAVLAAQPECLARAACAGDLTAGH